jgi:hypothetical protein
MEEIISIIYATALKVSQLRTSLASGLLDIKPNFVKHYSYFLNNRKIKIFLKLYFVEQYQ